MDETKLDDNYTRFVGWSQSLGCANGTDGLNEYYSPTTVKTISYKLTELLMGVDKDNRPIIVPDQTIINVMNEVENSFKPETGDIYTRYTIPSRQTTDMVQDMISQTIEIIYKDISNNLGMIENNNSLSIWTTVYGDFNAHGLRQHSQIKVRENRPQRMAFNMNY
jgi:hypothetical protein